MRANLRFGLATLLGATLEYIYLVRVNPPAASVEDELPTIPAVIALVLVVSAVDGIFHMRHLLRPVEAWLTEDRPPRLKSVSRCCGCRGTWSPAPTCTGC